MQRPTPDEAPPAEPRQPIYPKVMAVVRTLFSKNRDQPPWWTVLFACLLYMIVSMNMYHTNGQVTKFSSVPLTVCTIQLAFGAVILATVLRGTLHFGSREDVLRWGGTIPLFFSLSIGFNMLAMNATGESSPHLHLYPAPSSPFAPSSTPTPSHHRHLYRNAHHTTELIPHDTPSTPSQSYC